MPKNDTRKETMPHPHEQMLKLVAKGFYRELVNYGVKQAEVLTVAGHLLDNVVLGGSPAGKPEPAGTERFNVRDVQDAWAANQCLGLRDVALRPLRADQIPRLATWLAVPKVRNSFYPRFPQSGEALANYFQYPDCEYFAITHREEFVGIIGAEHIDRGAAKAEMKKLVGDPAMRGKGIGKHATFLFLYHAFVVRGLFKIYLHTMDINIRNLNLNGHFGFWLEGVMFEEVLIDDRRQDLIRMALTAPAWLGSFK